MQGFYIEPRAVARGFLLPLLLLACQTKPQKKTAETAFYYWKTAFNISKPETELLDSIFCKTLYVKVLDIGFDEETAQIEPLSALENSSKSNSREIEIVPTVFLTNEVFQKIKNPETLAPKVCQAVNQVFQNCFPGKKFREVQFDCDWTASTRQAYFQFLKNARQHSPKGVILSATVRLHQFKLPEATGVPPTDRAMLMLYNTGEIDSPEEKNSILEIGDLKKYLGGNPKKYPLPLDCALPLFSWAVVFREGEFWKIIPGMKAENFFSQKGMPLARGTKFNSLKINEFEVSEATFLEGHYLRPGDRIRVESVSPDLLLQAVGVAQKVNYDSKFRVAFFHLDPSVLPDFSASFLNSLCDSLEK